MRRHIEAFYFAYRAFTRVADDILESRGLNRVHHRILYFVGRHPGITVGELLEKARPLLAKVQNPIMDLESVVHCDSAGLALLLEWIEISAGRGQQLKFRNLPSALVGIAHLSNAETLLILAE